MNVKKFDSLYRSDFDNGAILDEIRTALKERDDLRASLEALLDWLGPLHDQGEQVGNLDMTLVDQARAAIAGAGE